jgi:RNA polymerase sigma-70 factor (ECF subfamily)
MPSALELFERHHRDVFRFLHRMTGSGAEAEDLTQEVFVRVVCSLPQYEERGLEKAWVFQIARNVWLDRQRALRRTVPAESLGAHVVAFPAMQLARLALDEALARLGEGEREAFLLRELGGLGYAEITRLTGGTESAVRNRIHRARLALRRILSGRTDTSAGASERGSDGE